MLPGCHRPLSVPGVLEDHLYQADLVLLPDQRTQRLLHHPSHLRDHLVLCYLENRLVLQDQWSP